MAARFSAMESLKTLEIHWAGQRRSWTLAQLPQQLDDPWRNLASPALQMPSDWPAVPHRTTSQALPTPARVVVIQPKRIASPLIAKQAVKWGRWMYCDDCQYHGDRDYCASVNIARLGVAYLLQMKHTGKARPCSISDPRVKPVSYTGQARCCCCHRRGTTLPETFGERFVTILVGLVLLSFNRLRKSLFFSGFVES